MKAGERGGGGWGGGRGGRGREAWGGGEDGGSGRICVLVHAGLFHLHNPPTLTLVQWFLCIS